MLKSNQGILDRIPWNVNFIVSSLFLSFASFAKEESGQKHYCYKGVKIEASRYAFCIPINFTKLITYNFLSDLACNNISKVRYSNPHKQIYNH